MRSKWGEKGSTLSKIHIASKKALNKSCSKLIFVQRSPRALMSINHHQSVCPFSLPVLKSRPCWSCHLSFHTWFSGSVEPWRFSLFLHHHGSKKQNGDRRSGDCQQRCHPGWLPKTGLSGMGVKRPQPNLTTHAPSNCLISGQSWNLECKWRFKKFKKIFFLICNNFPNIKEKL